MLAEFEVSDTELTTAIEALVGWLTAEGLIAVREPR
jgi:hypothetical protein